MAVATLDVPVCCSGETHILRLRERSDSQPLEVLHDHDVALERTFVDLGAALPSCLGIADDIAKHEDSKICDVADTLSCFYTGLKSPYEALRGDGVFAIAMHCAKDFNLHHATFSFATKPNIYGLTPEQQTQVALASRSPAIIADLSLSGTISTEQRIRLARAVDGMDRIRVALRDPYLYPKHGELSAEQRYELLADMDAHDRGMAVTHWRAGKYLRPEHIVALAKGISRKDRAVAARWPQLSYQQSMTILRQDY